MDDVKSHYQSFHGGKPASWVHSQPYFEFWAKNIIEILFIENHHSLLDFGCGNGKLLYELCQRRNFQCKPFGLEQDEICKHLNKDLIEPIHKDGLTFLANNQKKFDRVIFKQVFHHLVKQDRSAAKKVLDLIEKNGIILILSMPSVITYPMFEAAKGVFAKDEEKFNLEQIIEEFKTVSKVEISTVTYKTQVPKEAYFDAIRSRFISTLSQFSDEEIELGIQELSYLDNMVEIEDPLMSIKISNIKA